MVVHYEVVNIDSWLHHMPYRETDQVKARKSKQREVIIEAARRRIAMGGYQAAQMQLLAADAGIATGTIYRYFDSKAELFAEAFRVAVQTEVDAVDAAAHETGSPLWRLRTVVETFVKRALRAPRLAYALLAEPVDPLVENERLVFRQTYIRIIEAVVCDGLRTGDFAKQDPYVTAAGLVGLMNETLVGFLFPHPTTDSAIRSHCLSHDQLTAYVTALCLRAVSGINEVPQ